MGAAGPSRGYETSLIAYPLAFLLGAALIVERVIEDMSKPRYRSDTQKTGQPTGLLKKVKEYVP